MPNLRLRRREELELELSKSVANEKRLRARLTQLETYAAALRETRSTLLESHAIEMSDVRGKLTLACRQSTQLREQLRATDLL
jgi:hypothetical protein